MRGRGVKHPFSSHNSNNTKANVGVRRWKSYKGIENSTIPQDMDNPRLEPTTGKG
jgi:hypothetical protein